jgi:hypothetical protein
MLLENGDGLQAVLFAHIGVIIQPSDPPDKPLPIAVDAVVEVASQVVSIGLLSVAAQIDGTHDEVVDQGVLLAILVDRRHQQRVLLPAALVRQGVRHILEVWRWL